MRRLSAAVIYCLLCTVGLALPLSAGEPELVVAGVQFEVSEELYLSRGAFDRSVADYTRLAAAAGSELVVFPEYIGVFLAATPHAGTLRSSDSLSAAIRSISRAAGDQRSLRELFVQAAGEVSSRMDRLFGALAAENNVYILAGTYFHASGPGDREPGRLTNRAVVYGPTGERVYEQDKVFLTPFERDLIGLDAGTLDAVGDVEIDGVSVGITICKDTFYDAWDVVHDDRDLWIDIKADGVPFDQAARERYYTTIPERLEEAGVPYGMTVSLVGEFLNLFWEGRTSVVALRQEKLSTLDRSDSVRRADLVVEPIAP